MKVLFTCLFLTYFSVNSLLAKDSLSLYLFLLDDCPICIQYTPTINELHEAYGDQIEFIGYFPNFSSKKDKIAKFKNDFKLQFPLYTDYFKVQSRKFNAEVTPEVVLFNHTSEKVIYQGRIDNMFQKLGRKRKVITEFDLKNAIESTLNNRKVEKQYSKPVGCYINYSDNLDSKNQPDKN